MKICLFIVIILICLIIGLTDGENCVKLYEQCTDAGSCCKTIPTIKSSFRDRVEHYGVECRTNRIIGAPKDAETKTISRCSLILTSIDDIDETDI